MFIIIGYIILVFFILLFVLSSDKDPLSKDNWPKKRFLSFLSEKKCTKASLRPKFFIFSINWYASKKLAFILFDKILEDFFLSLIFQNLIFLQKNFFWFKKLKRLKN